MVDQIKWKHGVVGNQPIAGYQIKPDMWVIVGGTFKAKDKLEQAGAKFSYAYYAHAYEGAELPTELASLIDFIHPLVPEKKEEEKGGVRPQIRKWYRKPHNTIRLSTMYYKEPQPVSDFVPPSYWDEYLFYLQNPHVYPSIAIVGPSGNGKTTTAIAAQESLGIQYMVADITESVMPEDLIGAMTYHPERGEIWVDGIVSQAFRLGMNLIINEFDAANPRAALCLQSVLQDPGKKGKGRYVTTPGCPDHDRIYPQGACSVTVTMNTYGSGASRMYTGRNVMDQATLDRFAFIGSGYEHEVEIIMSRGYKKRTATQLEKWAQEMRKKIDENALKLNVSPRTLLRMAHLMEMQEISLADAAQKQFLNRVDPEDRELLV